MGLKSFSVLNRHRESPLSFFGRPASAPKPRRPSYRPRLEALEDRQLLSTFLVTDTNNAGPGSLRQAILKADTHPGPNSIRFNINGGGFSVIAPTSPLPAITGAVDIEGATQPGFAGSPLVLLDGNGAGSSANGLLLTADDCRVDALAIVGFGRYGIDIQGGTGIAVTRCDIGVIPFSTGFANGAGGLRLSHGAHGDTITGNVISSNGGDGVNLIGAGTDANMVAANRIGTTMDGISVLGNSLDGIAILGGASNNTVSGNTLSGNAFDGVRISGVGTTGNVVRNNRVGLGAAGASNLANGVDGVAIEKGASQNRLAGNVLGFHSDADVLIDHAALNSLMSNYVGISRSGANIGNPSGVGIWIKNGSVKNSIVGNDIGNSGGASFLGGVQLDGPGTTGNLIQSNIIGLNRAGAAAGNGYGIVIASGASKNTVGGVVKSLGNVISANFQADVAMFGTNTWGNVVESNLIGTNAAGTAAAQSQSVYGVQIGNASFNRVGGIGTGNVISGNSGAATGIQIAGATAVRNVVQGNFIGTNATGTAAISNTYGVVIQAGASGNQIGGTLAGDGNVISANTGDGVFIDGVGTSHNVVQGNRVGVGVKGQALGNGTGVFIAQGASDNLIGGTVPSAGNIIAHNMNQGVAIGTSITDTTTARNALLGNSIFGNGGLGIDLASDGVTANQPAGTPGPNDFQNFPVLSHARLAGGEVVVRGTLASTANTTFRIEFFASASADLSGHGQGRFFLGFVNVTTNGSGNTSFKAALPFTGAPGKVISATATAYVGSSKVANPKFGDTSEFSGDLTAF
jgi:titin